jgi:hypothetical protein
MTSEYKSAKLHYEARTRAEALAAALTGMVTVGEAYLPYDAPNGPCHKRLSVAKAALSSAGAENVETCGDCMGSGYSGHPDSGQVCYACKGSGGVASSGAGQEAEAVEPFGYWCECKGADPAFLRKPSYIPPTDALHTTTPLYTRLVPAQPQEVAVKPKAVETAKLARDVAARMIDQNIQWRLDPLYIIELCDEIDRLSALASPAQAVKWQPIETAPKDGTWVLAVRAGYIPETCFWDGEEWLFDEGQDPGTHYHPTHWMPLPTGPAQVVKDKGGEE